MIENKATSSLGIVVAALTLAATFASGVAWAGADRTRLEAELAGDSLASGKAKWEQRGDRRKLSVEGEDMSGGTATVSLFCQTTQVEAVVLVDGFFDLNLDSRVGDTVPVCADGDLVTVTDSAGNTISEAFGPK